MHALGALLASSPVDIFESLLASHSQPQLDPQAQHGNEILHHYLAYIEEI